jgi:transmembrane sensor
MTRIEFFLTNPEFVRWVKESDKKLDEYWEKWMEANPDAFPDIMAAKEIISSMQFKELQADAGVKEAVLTKILKNDAFEKRELHYSKDGSGGQNIWFWSRMGQVPRIAAILFITLSVPLFYFLSNPKRKEELEVVIATVQKDIAKGEKLSLTLPDGTRVWINSGSSLSYPEIFDKDLRQVKLEGEAYFEIEEDTLRPFEVVSGGFVTTALGTSFNVKSQPGSALTVSLMTGKVKVAEEESGEDYFLEPGLEFIDNLLAGQRTVRKFNPEKVLAWKDGKIIFENATLPEVVKTLEDWYGVEINLVNAENEKWKFSGEYKNEILENVLNSMSFIEKFEYKINGKNIELIF